MEEVPKMDDRMLKLDSTHIKTTRPTYILLALLLIVIAISSTPSAFAYTTVIPDGTQQSQYQPPSSIILIIMDGTGAPYFSGNAHTIDGANVPTIAHTPIPSTANPIIETIAFVPQPNTGPCLLYTSPSPRD